MFAYERKLFYDLYVNSLLTAKKNVLKAIIMTEDEGYSY